jgi:hypothetical protein
MRAEHDQIGLEAPGFFDDFGSGLPLAGDRRDDFACDGHGSRKLRQLSFGYIIQQTLLEREQEKGPIDDQQQSDLGKFAGSAP